MSEFFVHESSYIDENVKIGQGTKIWFFCHIEKGANIGQNCVLGQNVNVSKNVTIGNGCKIQNNVSLYEGVTLEENVFCGPSCVFTNDLTPRAAYPKGNKRMVTLIKKGASIGANATIVCGHTIGRYSMIAAGAVVTKNVPDYTLVAGVPAVPIGFVDEFGNVSLYKRIEDKRKMEFRDLKTQYLKLKNEIDNNILKVINRADFISGKEVTELENELAEYVEVKHCITCANGTDALSLALMAWKIGPGDAVFVPDFTFFASAETVAAVGATPVFVDVDPKTFNISTSSLIQAIESVQQENKLIPKVIVTVDLFGLPANYFDITEISKRYNLKILEDGAQGFGGKIGEKRVCSFGDISTTSFFPAKPLGCYGDGGAIFTNDDSVASLIRSLCVHGKGSSKYENIHIGVNSRLDTIQAAVLLVKFKAFKEYELERVNEVAERYSEMLNDYVEVPYIPSNYYSSWAQYTIKLNNKTERDALAQFLLSNQIPTLVYYPITMHEQKAFAYLKNYVPCENSKRLTDICVSIPMGPYLKKGEQDFIVSKIIEFKIKFLRIVK